MIPLFFFKALADFISIAAIMDLESGILSFFLHPLLVNEWERFTLILFKRVGEWKSGREFTAKEQLPVEEGIGRPRAYSF